MRSIKQIHQARYEPIADLKTLNALPLTSPELTDPFIFLNHHGPQTYPQRNNGLPFGPHPHRGMETVTFILDGDIMHQDSDGHDSVVTAGGVQWMTAGKGLVHAEISSQDFKKTGGKLEILQLWLNLPASHKMSSPQYIGKQKDEIVSFTAFAGVSMDLVSGRYHEYEPSFDIRKDIFLSLLTFDQNSQYEERVPVEDNILLYVIDGDFMVNDKNVKTHQLVEFDKDNLQINIKALSSGVILFGHARPFGEPIVAKGPFVMNTMAEIYDAYEDYHKGLLGRL
jgi:quercetin 2,3-dioxygenase